MIVYETSKANTKLPEIAKRFEEKTMKGSRVTPKTAGIESTCKHERKCISSHITQETLGYMGRQTGKPTANAISLSSMTATVRSKGVA